MKRMKPLAAVALLLLLLLLCQLPISHGLRDEQEDDLVFDDAVEETPGHKRTEYEARTQTEAPREQRKSKSKKWQPVERLLGMADGIATVGHVFKLHVPKQAFSGSVDYYEARGSNGRGLPHWLRWDEPAEALFGVPSHKDIGRHRIVIKAYGKTGDVTQDSFFVHVVPEITEIYAHTDEKKHSCSIDQDRTMLGILMDARYDSLKPGAKVNALENLAGFLGLNTRTVSIHPDNERESSASSSGSSVVLSGPGNVGQRREKHATIVQWQVGCDGHFWPHQIDVIKQIPEQAKDGTLAEVLQLPVYQWRVRSEPNDYARTRRDAAGSGDDLLPDEEDEEYDEDYEDEEYDGGEGITETPQEPRQKPVIRTGGGPVDEHPHRHHHGEDNIASIGADLDNDEDFIWRNTDLNNAVVNTTTSTTTTTTPSTYSETSPVPAKIPPTTSFTSVTTESWSDNSTEEEIPGEPVDSFDSVHVSVSSSTPSTTTSTTTQSTTTTTTTTPTTTTTTSTPETTTPLTTTTTTTTLAPTPTTTTTQSTTTSTTTEKIEYGVRNLSPKVEKRLKKIAVTQGKLLSYTIPEDTFSDPEDGNTRQLRLRIYEKAAPLKASYWLQFNEQTQEVYGLPLGEQYGTYPFEVIAMDSEGLTTSDRLDIIVQQHKQIRAFNHEFHVYVRIEKRSEFPTNVDWELKVMRSLAELYGDSDLSHITVRSIDIDNDQAIYTWTNDSLARSSICPQEEIKRLYKVLVSDEKSEDPSADLIRVLGPEIKPKRVVYQGLEQCEQTKETQANKYPSPRNQIDQLNATVGQLFVYTVPQDTFFDEEDGDTRSMKASLLTANRTEIPPWDWLQFDSSNQEFYGVPLKHDIGRKTYQLVVKDREGLEATDSLVAEVHQSPMIRHVFEISMTLNMPYETFAHSAQKKREFIQRLQKLYGDKNANAISLVSINGNRDTTAVTWRNITLPTYECPDNEIKRLRRVLGHDNNSFTDELNREFNHNSQQPEFAVIQMSVRQMGACEDLAIGGPEMPPIDDSTSVGASHDDYLITFVLPAIIVAAMLILAGIIACILYKRRRSGKMSISEKDDERQSFRSKGIPVIFQDELDEKPDPGNKSPIILKEEKPPLPPPEYQRAEDGADIPMLAKENSEEPYQPPPPFATNRDNNRQNRPKPTPTYRKPPPYVPP